MIYNQKTGTLVDGDTTLGIGWAGHGLGKNNPDMQNVKDVGPLPKGTYYIQDPVEHTHLGPLALPLIPDPKNTMLGRGSFYIHGANIHNPAISSDGCIIQSNATRVELTQKIRGTQKDAPERTLQVV